MNWLFQPAALIPLATAPFALGLGLFALRQHRRGVSGALAVAVMLFSSGVWILGTALQLMAASDGSRWWAIQIRTLGMTTVPLALLILALTYADRRHWLRPARLLLLALVPAVTLILGWTNDLHSLMWRGPLLEAGSSSAEIYSSFGIARWVNMGYNYLLVAISVVVLLTLHRRSELRTVMRSRTGAVLLGITLTLLANALYRFRPDLLPVDLTPIMFTLAGLTLSAWVLQIGWMNLLQIAQQNTGNIVPTPILVLDETNRVADLNQAAQTQFQLTPRRAIGRPLTELLGTPTIIGEALEQAGGEPVELTLTLNGIDRIYMLRSSWLGERQGQKLGRVTVWYDITEWRNAERALQENESFLRQVIDSNPHHIYVKNPEGRYLLVNAAKAAYHGLPVEEFVGKTAHLFLDDEQAEAHTRTDLEVLAQGKTKQIPAAASVHGASGETHWLEATVTPLKAVDGTPMGVLSVATDVTSQVRFEELIDRQIRFEQLINRISGEFINQKPGSYETTIVRALGAIASFVEADSGGTMRLNEAQRTVTCSHEWCAPGIERRHQQPTDIELPQKPWWLHRLKAGETVFISDLNQLPPVVRSSLQADGARSLIAIPISVKGNLYGYLYLLWLRQRATWQQSEVALLKFVGDLFANVFERQRSDETLRESEKRFRLLAQNATDLISLTSPDEVFTYVSAASETLLGYRPEEMLGRSMGDFVHPYDQDWQIGSRHGTEPNTRTFRVRHRDGHYLWVERISRGIVDPASGEIIEIQSSTRDVTARVEAEQKLMHANIELNAAYDATIEGWARALELRDEETKGHSQRVTEMTVQLGRALGLSEEELVIAHRGALLHDMGKLGVPDHILHKPDKLTPEEWAIMRQHPVYAYEWLKHVAFLKPALDIPYSHHEKWDGSGYPQGLKGEEIPLLARIFAVIDVYDALMYNRPYRAAWPLAKVLKHIEQLSGTHFDPKVTKVFLEMMSTENWTAGEYEATDEEAIEPEEVIEAAVQKR